MADLSASFNPALIATTSDAASSALALASTTSDAASSALAAASDVSSKVAARTDQSVKSAASPTFGGLTLTGNVIVPNGGTIGQAAGPLLTFDDTNNKLVITGCKIGLGTTVIDYDFAIVGAAASTAGITINAVTGYNSLISLGAGEAVSASIQFRNDLGDSLLFQENSNSTLMLRESNIGIGQLTFGTNATKTLALGTGVAPTSSPADCFQLYSADFNGVAGQACTHCRTEGGTIVRLNQDVSTLASPTFIDLQITEHAYFDAEVDNGDSGDADTIDWTVGNKQKSTLTDDCTYTFTEPSGPCNLVLKLVQDGTGGRTVTWPGDVKWPSGTAPTLTTAASAVDIVCFYYDGADFYGNISLNFSVPS